MSGKNSENDKSSKDVPEKWYKQPGKYLKSPKVWVPLILAVLASLAIELTFNYLEEGEGEDAHAAELLKSEIAGRTKLVLNLLDSYKISLGEGYSALRSFADKINPDHLRSLSKHGDENLAHLLQKLMQVSKQNCLGDKILKMADLSAKNIRRITPGFFLESDNGYSKLNSFVETWIKETENKLKFIDLIQFLDAKNEFLPPRGYDFESHMTVIDTMRAECRHLDSQ